MKQYFSISQVHSTFNFHRNSTKMEQKLFEFLEKYMLLTDLEKNAILELGVFRSVKKGTVLLKEGQYSTDSYFVLEGCIRTYYMIEGEEKTTAFYTELEPFAPLCSINQQPSELYIDCVEDSILILSNPEVQKQSFAQFPRFESLCRVLSEQLLVKTRTTLDDFKTNTPEQRYLNLVERRPDLIQRVPQHQIASFLGITPQSLSRMRKRLATSIS
jgi:CRP-like cAMP-binding protein